jgi:DNA-binding beta-propeller fold protein YncE
MTIGTNKALLTAALLAALAGCNNGGKTHASASTSAPVTSSGGAPITTAPVTTGSVTPITTTSRVGSSPAVTLLAMVSPVTTSAVRLDYTLADADADRAALLVEASIDDGRTWRVATDAGAAAGSDGAVALVTTATGHHHTFVWDAAQDVGRAYRRFARLRLSPSDVDGAGAAVMTPAFTLDATVAPARLLTLGVPLDPAGLDQPIAYDLSTQGGLAYRSLQPTQSGGRGRQMSSSSGLVATPKGDVVVMSHNDSRQLSVYLRQPSGDLTLVGNPVACAGNPTELVMHPSGKFVYTTNGSALEAFGFDAQGALRALPGSPFQVGSSPRGLAVDPRGDALYTGHMFGADVGVRVHRLDPMTGVPTFASALSFGQTASRPGKTLCVDPSGQRLYCLDLDAGVFVATIHPTTRALTPVTGASPRPLGGFAMGMALSTRGDALYATVLNVGLVALRITPTGAFVTAPGSPYANVGATTLYLATDATDRFLVSTSRTDDSLRVYAIEPTTKALVEVPGSPRRDYTYGVVVGPVLALP